MFRVVNGHFKIFSINRRKTANKLPNTINQVSFLYFRIFFFNEKRKKFLQTVKLHKIQEQFWKIYRTSSVQLRAIEQQRLLAVREQMRLTVNLTLNNKGSLSFEFRKFHRTSHTSFTSTVDDNKLFTSNNLDQILNEWDEQHLISIDHWSQFPRRSLISRYDSSINLLDEIKQVIDECFYQRQTQPEALLRKDSTVSDGTVSHI